MCLFNIGGIKLWFQVQIIVFRNDIDFGLDLKFFLCTFFLKREIYTQQPNNKLGLNLLQYDNIIL